MSEYDSDGMYSDEEGYYDEYGEYHAHDYDEYDEGYTAQHYNLQSLVRGNLADIFMEEVLRQQQRQQPKRSPADEAIAAFADGDMEWAERALSAGGFLADGSNELKHPTDKEGWVTLLQYAVRNAWPKVVRRLLRDGVRDEPNKFGQTALHWAAHYLAEADQKEARVAIFTSLLKSKGVDITHTARVLSPVHNKAPTMLQTSALAILLVRDVEHRFVKMMLQAGAPAYYDNMPAQSPLLLARHGIDVRAMVAVDPSLLHRVNKSVMMKLWKRAAKCHFLDTLFSLGASPYVLNSRGHFFYHELLDAQHTRSLRRGGVLLVPPGKYSQKNVDMSEVEVVHTEERERWTKTSADSGTEFAFVCATRDANMPLLNKLFSRLDKNALLFWRHCRLTSVEVLILHEYVDGIRELADRHLISAPIAKRGACMALRCLSVDALRVLLAKQRGSIDVNDVLGTWVHPQVFVSVGTSVNDVTDALVSFPCLHGPLRADALRNALTAHVQHPLALDRLVRRFGLRIETPAEAHILRAEAPRRASLTYQLIHAHCTLSAAERAEAMTMATEPAALDVLLRYGGKPDVLRCAQCGKRGGGGGSALQRCSKCKAVCYCGAEHQRAHWPLHKKVCAWWEREGTKVELGAGTWSLGLGSDDESGVLQFRGEAGAGPATKKRKKKKKKKPVRK